MSARAHQQLLGGDGAFAGLLTALGFRVSLLSARVFSAGQQPGPPLDRVPVIDED
jgi:arylamine N-acetyltransferase